MPNERRLGPRRQLTLEVMLEHSRLGLRRYQTRDVSLDGVFIEASDIPLRRNTLVDLVLRIPADGKTRHHRVRAKLAPLKNRGARFIFHKLDERTYTALVDLLYGGER